MVAWRSAAAVIARAPRRRLSSWTRRSRDPGSGRRHGAQPRIPALRYAPAGMTGRRSSLALQRRVGIAHAVQIRGAGAGIELGEERVVVRLRGETAHRVGLVVAVAEGDRLGRAGGLAGGDDLARADRPVLGLGVAPGAGDALDAIGAFFHDAAGADRDVRIARCRDNLGAEVGIFLAVRIAEEIEAPHLVRTI